MSVPKIAVLRHLKSGEDLEQIEAIYHMTKIGKILAIFFGSATLLLFVSSFVFSSQMSYGDSPSVATGIPETKKPEVIHLKTPEPLKGIYMTQCVASMSSLRDSLVGLIERTELNAVIIDVKDYTGTVSFETGIPEIDNLNKNGSGCRVPDLRDFIKTLHKKNIYVIARITVFQDPLYVKAHPEFAVKKKNGVDVWKDRKGISFIDPGSRPFWDYIVSIADASYNIGFDEVNFDYIRYPSDGNMQDISFIQTGALAKKEMMKKFFEYLDSKLSASGIVTSADLFGMTTTNSDDLGIGQVLEYALLNFDYVCPMVYPSHYPPKFNGWPDPNKVPYDIVKFSLDSALNKEKYLYAEISATSTVFVDAAGQATSTPKIPDHGAMKRVKPAQIRPWLQDFDYPVTYTPAMVRTQIQATYDADLTSWTLWDPSNKYTKEALLPQSEL